MLILLVTYLTSTFGILWRARWLDQSNCACCQVSEFISGIKKMGDMLNHSPLLKSSSLFSFLHSTVECSPWNKYPSAILFLVCSLQEKNLLPLLIFGPVPWVVPPFPSWCLTYSLRLFLLGIYNMAEAPDTISNLFSLFLLPYRLLLSYLGCSCTF